jgi:lipopolysaccharide transport system permease protein
MSSISTALKPASQSKTPHVRICAGEQVRLIDVPELIRYRDLLWTLADRDIRVRYKQTALGVIWVILQPLMASLIFAFVFGVVAGLPSDGRPYVLFAFAGMTAWNVFSGVLTKVSASLVSNAQMLSKIYFPRLILPLSSTISALVDSAFSLALMLIMLALYRVWPGLGIFLLPVWLFILVVLSLGIGLLAASMIVRYRDVAHIIPIALQLGLFISPVAWAITSKMKDVYRLILWLNPLSSLVQATRWSLLGEGMPPWPALAYSIAVSAALFWLGVTVFKRQERSFADVI